MERNIQVDKILKKFLLILKNIVFLHAKNFKIYLQCRTKELLSF